MNLPILKKKTRVCDGIKLVIPLVGENFFVFPLAGEGEIWYDVRVHKEKQS